jgi:enamine deaminase RidA (YjgF/YER057c/UK114 family)
MRRIMAKAGGSLDDLVTMTVYTTERRWGETFTDMRKEVFKTGYPSSAFMEARKLLTPGALLEIQAIAVLYD